MTRNMTGLVSCSICSSSDEITISASLPFDMLPARSVFVSKACQNPENTTMVFGLLYGYGAGMSMDRHGANHGNTFKTSEEDPAKVIASINNAGAGSTEKSQT